MPHRLVQCLCPNRHCILALAVHAGTEGYESDDDCRRILEGAVFVMVQEGRINPWCGICHQPMRNWTYEVGALGGDNWDALQDRLQECQRKQMEAAKVLQLRERARMN